MRLFSWYGLGTVLVALACGYAAGVAHHCPTDCTTCYPPPIPSREEEATPPPLPPGQALLGPRLAPPETIDLTTPPTVMMAVEANPTADVEISQVKFEVPSGGDAPPYMPYLDEEPVDFTPTRYMNGPNPGFASDLDIPIRSGSFQYGIPPVYNSCESFTEIALGYWPVVK